MRCKKKHTHFNFQETSDQSSVACFVLPVLHHELFYDVGHHRRSCQVNIKILVVKALDKFPCLGEHFTVFFVGDIF